MKRKREKAFLTKAVRCGAYGELEMLLTLVILKLHSPHAHSASTTFLEAAQGGCWNKTHFTERQALKRCGDWPKVSLLPLYLSPLPGLHIPPPPPTPAPRQTVNYTQEARSRSGQSTQ